MFISCSSLVLFMNPWVGVCYVIYSSNYPWNPWVGVCYIIYSSNYPWNPWVGVCYVIYSSNYPWNPSWTLWVINNIRRVWRYQRGNYSITLLLTESMEHELCNLTTCIGRSNSSIFLYKYNQYLSPLSLWDWLSSVTIIFLIFDIIFF
jgi:hypothetical protein